jgi:polysaccharide export outer membrane protein
VAAVGLSGCATIVKGTKTGFSAAPTPPGAAAKTSNGYGCAATPCSVKIPRKDAFDVTAAKPGYSDPDALSYKLGPGDKLNIITFDETQLTGVFAVNSKGAISLPWIGDVPAVGRTETQVRDDMVARLRDGYIINPQVSVQVLALRPYYILGEVNKPGQYPYVSGLTVMGAVATAQGFTYRANQRKVLIKHVGQGNELKVPLTAGTEVQVGDTIRIVERYF